MQESSIGTCPWTQLEALVVDIAVHTTGMVDTIITICMLTLSSRRHLRVGACPTFCLLSGSKLYIHKSSPLIRSHTQIEQHSLNLASMARHQSTLPSFCSGWTYEVPSEQKGSVSVVGEYCWWITIRYQLVRTSSWSNITRSSSLTIAHTAAMFWSDLVVVGAPERSSSSKDRLSARNSANQSKTLSGLVLHHQMQHLLNAVLYFY